MKTTRKHFKIFCDEARKWIKTFGLLDWDISFTHESRINGLASCHSDTVSRRAVLNLEPDWGDRDPVTNKSIRVTAFHEVCELLLAPLSICASTRFNISEDEITESVHTVISVLQNVVFK